MNQETFKNTVFVLKDEMYRFAKRFLVSSDEAEDLVQDLMLKFWQKKDELVHLNLKSYVLKCVKNECLNKLKHETVKQNFADFQLHRNELYKMETNNLKEKILEFINALPEKQKLVIHLKDVEEYEVSEISEILEIEENAVRVNLMRARQKIKEQINNLLAFENRKNSKHLKPETMNPNIDKEYQNIFRELKEEKMDWNFEDFLKKTEEKPEENKVIPLQKKSGGGNQKWYWMAASLVTLFGMMMFFNPDITEPTLKPIASNESNSSEKPAQTNIIKPTKNQDINNNSNIIKITKNNVKPTKKINHEFRNEHQNIASQPSKTVEKSTEILENPAEEYSADYVIVNGKKIYNEEEAIDITKEAFQLFASNVTKTINQAEPIKNLSINF